MNGTFQSLKNCLYDTWYADDIFFEETRISPSEWDEINSAPSQYFNNFIQRWPVLANSKQIAEIPIDKRIWKEKEKREAQISLYKLIAISFPFTSVQVPHADAVRLVEDVFHLFSPPVLSFCSYFPLTYATFEERLVIVDPQKLLFVMRLEED